MGLIAWNFPKNSHWNYLIIPTRCSQLVTLCLIISMLRCFRKTLYFPTLFIMLPPAENYYCTYKIYLKFFIYLLIYGIWKLISIRNSHFYALFTHSLNLKLKLSLLSLFTMVEWIWSEIPDLFISLLSLSRKYPTKHWCWTSTYRKLP